ncbi:MAG: hypothetical protein WCW26_00420 [Candidatus Buchananbacteria bacterium]
MKELIKSITKAEWKFLILLILVLIVITTLPYFIGYSFAPSNKTYNGLHALIAGDIPVYYSYIDQVKTGQIFLKDLFTSENQDLGTLNVWWLLVGWLAWIFNLTPLLAFHFSRILMIPIFVFVAYLFLAYFFKSVLERRVALIFTVFSSGLGAYFANFFDQLGWENIIPYRWPIDLWLGEGIIFNTLCQTSHFIASITLTLLIFLLLLLAFEKNNFIYAVISGFLALFYFNFHPYYFPVIFLVPGIYLLLLFIKEKKIIWPNVWILAVTFFISLPSVFYHFWLIKSSLVVGQRAAQNVTLISPPLFVLIGFGFLWPGFVLGLYFLIKKNKFDAKLKFLLIWLIVNLVLAYSPFPFQSRYAQGIQVVLVIFTVSGIFYGLEYLKSKIKPKTFDFWFNNSALFFILFVIFLAPSNLYNLTRDLYYFTYKPGQIGQILYLPKGFDPAFVWFRSQPGQKIILASDIPARFIPGFSGQTVYVGHLHETLFAYSKVMYLTWFLKDNSQDELKYKFLLKNKIDYLFYSDYEKRLGDFNPTQKDYLKSVYKNADVEIFEVIKK